MQQMGGSGAPDQNLEILENSSLNQSSGFPGGRSMDGQLRLAGDGSNMQDSRSACIVSDAGLGLMLHR